MHDTTELLVQFVFQFAIILIAARSGGTIAQRYLKLPAVLGELCAGMVISPYALGGISAAGLPPLFPDLHGPLPISLEIYSAATLGSILLLFVAGLETDLAQFLRYSVAGSVVGFFGVAVSFIMGSICAVWFGIAEQLTDPSALFLGALCTATSVGITARVLAEKHYASAPEGVTIMAAAVLDDVLGLIILAVVVGMARAGAGTSPDWQSVGVIALKALGFWIACTATAILLSRWISRLLKAAREPATISCVSFGLALLLAGVVEKAGLAMIIGGYIMGLALSRTDLAMFLQNQLNGLYQTLVPVFFCVMGMLVDFSAMKGVVVLGLVYSLMAFLAKVVGCGAPAMLVGFNLRGGLRIGLGMLPRGEVALIMAGVGLTSGIIGPDLFGAAIMMTVLTTIVAPPLLTYVLDESPGHRSTTRSDGHEEIRMAFDLASPDFADFVLLRILRMFREEEFFVGRLHGTRQYQIRKDSMVFSLAGDGHHIVLRGPPTSLHVARLIVAEALVSVQGLFDELSKAERSPVQLGEDLIGHLFEGVDQTDDEGGETP